ncbi:unannotated protein [freshwater metagenome]|uniref:Unannotated protein n=1 Tax=freshwater metagenome TaxID=449393 RepID=A0A6J6A185_9ZZZZ
MSVAEPVVGVEQPRDSLNVAQLRVVNLNLIGGRLTLAALTRELSEGDQLFRHNALSFDRGAESFAFTAEVHEPQVVSHRLDLGQFGRHSIEPATEGRNRLAPILDRAAHCPFGEFELYNELTGRIARVGAFNHPGRKRVDNLLQPLGVGGLDPARDREALDNAVNKRKFASFAADRYPYAVRHRRSLR